MRLGGLEITETRGIVGGISMANFDLRIRGEEGCKDSRRHLLHLPKIQFIQQLLDIIHDELFVEFVEDGILE